MQKSNQITFPRKKKARTGHSNAFTSISREKAPTWSNRFVKDSHDLVYNVANITFKIKRQKKATPISEEELPSDHPAAKYEYSPARSRLLQSNMTQREEKGSKKIEELLRSTSNTLKKEGYQESAQSPRNNQIKRSHLQERNQSPSRNNKISINRGNSQRMNMLGLSKFQFSKTIEGRVNFKSDLNLLLSKSLTSKINNLNKIWYSSKQLNPEPIKPIASSQIQRIHSFKSYSAHKLFMDQARSKDDNGCGWGGMLDKVYEHASNEKYDMIRQRSARGIQNFKKTLDRPGIFKKVGTNLQYEVNGQQIGKGDGKRAIIPLFKSQKKLIISRQVISSARGCYR